MSIHPASASLVGQSGAALGKHVKGTEGLGLCLWLLCSTPKAPPAFGLWFQTKCARTVHDSTQKFSSAARRTH